MRKRQRHEEHQNHESWAIPYGDLITLLLAFFVVMYAISSVNEGKYRILADSLSAAFAGQPRTMRPVEIGEKPQARNEGPPGVSLKTRPFEINSPARVGEVITTADTPDERELDTEALAESRPLPIDLGGGAMENLKHVAEEVERAMQDLIEQDLVVVRRTELWLEVEIKTDILFPSAVARISPSALPILHKLAETLRPFPNAIRVEGHTDNRPIATLAFPSNWELSAARAASVVHLFQERGIEPQRMAVLGLGEHRPVASNATPEGRNRNRRVVLVVMAEGLEADRRVVEQEQSRQVIGDAGAMGEEVSAP